MNNDRFRSTHPHLTEFNSFLEELNKESDRGAALISTAMLDDLLGRVAPVSGFYPNHNEGGPGPSLLGTGETMNFDQRALVLVNSGF